MRGVHRYLRRRAVPDVDVTAFLSLMVILVPFLMITAVFSRITILELEAAASTQAATAKPDPLKLNILIRKTFIEVSFQGQSAPQRFARTPDGQALQMLGELVTKLKARFPQSTQATLLLEPQISYDELVQVMDVVRVREDQVGDETQLFELFPQITLGETPIAKPGKRVVK